MRTYALQSIQTVTKAVALEYTSHERRNAKIDVIRRMIASNMDSGNVKVREYLIAADYLLEIVPSAAGHTQARTVCFMALDMINSAMCEHKGEEPKPVRMIWHSGEQDFVPPSEDMEDIPF